MVGKMEWLSGLVRVHGLGDDLAASRGDSMQLLEQPLRLFETAEQAEIIAHHDDGIKGAVPEASDRINGHEPHILDAAQLADLHRAAGVVDARYFKPLLLQV